VGELETLNGQSSWTLGNAAVDIAVTEQGGHLTARFTAAGSVVNPFYTAPWWNETLPPGTPEVIRVLRGDFFCLPFGNGPVAHGRTANDPWRFEGIAEQGRSRELTLSMDLGPGEGHVRKRIRIMEGEPVIYQEHAITGFTGAVPLGHHPILKLPDRPGAGILDMSPPVAGFTTPERIEDPAGGGYSSIASGCEITDRSRVPTERGTTVDLTRYPTPRGFEDLVCFVSDPHRAFAFSSVSVPGEGWLYFQLKDPRVLAETVLWMSNGGRHYPPWNGRVVSVLGLEEVTAFFHYGRERSLGPNPFRDRGFPCACEPGPEGDLRVRFLMGLVPIGPGFAGVEDIVRKDAATVTIRGRGGERIDVACRVDFLAG
jgi:hypothetical protein